MANEGIMALPQGAGMQDDQASEMPAVTSFDAYDAAQTALGMARPEEQDMLRQTLRENMQELELTPSELEQLIEVFEQLSQRPDRYKQMRDELIRDDVIDPEDIPEEYDPEFLGAVLAVLNELKTTSIQGAQAPMMEEPPMEGMGAMPMAQGGLADVASYLASQGRRGDSMLAHITPEEAQLLTRRGGAGTINPNTGMPEFFLKQVAKAFKSVVKSVVNVVKKVAKSPVGRILMTVALATVLGPAGIGLASTTAGAAGLASAGTTLIGGGSLKDALVSGAMGYIGGGGTVMGASPVSALGGYLPGAAGSALNTGLSTGLIGAGIGKLSGMSTADALKMGLTSGASAAAMAGVRNNTTLMDGRVTAEDIARSNAATGTPGQASGQFTNSGDIGQVGTAGTAQDLLSGRGLDINRFSGETGLTGRVDGANAFRTMYGPADASSYGLAPAGSSGEPGFGARLPSSLGAADLSSAAGGTGATTNYDLMPRAAAPAAASGGGAGAAAGGEQGFFDRMAQGAKDFYNENISPSRPGLPKDVGLLRQYGPAAALTYGAVSAFGGTKSSPANQNPAFNRNYTGDDYIRDNPDRFRGGLGGDTMPGQPPSPVVVPTPRYGSIPVGGPGLVTPGGITNSPAGVAQPYNVAGLYGVPLLYGQPQGLAKGGQPQPTEFPRKTGPINGPGTGTSDSIPAMLSDGEFVFTARAVRNAGGGSRRKGAARMYKLMKKLEGGAVKA
jgi:hypothetical protein